MPMSIEEVKQLLADREVEAFSLGFVDKKDARYPKNYTLRFTWVASSNPFRWCEITEEVGISNVLHSWSNGLTFDLDSLQCEIVLPVLGEVVLKFPVAELTLKPEKP